MNKMKIKYENGSITISTRVIYMINRTNIINYLSSSSSISNELLNFHINIIIIIITPKVIRFKQLWNYQ